MKLRDYQREAVDAVLQARIGDRHCNPLVVLPTGSGKSLVIAALIRDVCSAYGPKRFLVLTHVKELVDQNEKEFRKLCPYMPTGVVCAGLSRKEFGRQVTFGTIQSAYRHHDKFADVAAVIVDEAHLVGNFGRYRDFLEHFPRETPVIGLTATPYRLRSGHLTEGKDRIFTDVVHESKPGELVRLGYLCKLDAFAGADVDMGGVKMSHGDFVQSDAARAMDRATKSAVLDLMERTDALGCKSVLIFACTILHAQQIALSIPGAVALSSECTKIQRLEILHKFRTGRLRYLVNVGVLTTGFNHPALDCIVFLRPTCSPGLYVQMSGRGMRTFPGKERCVVLDYAGNVKRLGTIENPRIEEQEFPEKEPKPEEDDKEKMRNIQCACGSFNIWEPGMEKLDCWQCGEDMLAHVLLEVEEEARKQEALQRMAQKLKAEPEAVDIMGVNRGTSAQYITAQVFGMQLLRHQKPGSHPCVRVVYSCGTFQVSEFVALEHGGYAAKKAAEWLYDHEIEPDQVRTCDDLLGYPQEQVRVPKRLELKKQTGSRYWDVWSKDW